MFKKIFFLSLILLAYGCSQSIDAEKLQNLNGYWEISEVVFANGENKTYSVNTLVDFIVIKDMKGTRTKVAPDLSGNFRTNGDTEVFEIIPKDDTFLLSYKKEQNQWEEELKTLETNSFSVKNEDGKIYVYQRFEPINVNP